MYCITGKHYWINPEDAKKCCNGNVRKLVIGGDISKCDTIGIDPLPGGVRYGYKWVKKDEGKE